MARNTHNGDWRDVPIGDLLSKMDEELEELREAVARGNSVEVLLEAADVAVCAMMIMDQHLGSPRPAEMQELQDQLSRARTKPATESDDVV